MEHMWDVLVADFFKINVQCEISTVPSSVGNTVAIGVILRDEGGEKVWGAQGPMNHLTEEQALMAGIQAVVVHAREKKWELTRIETTNRDIFDLISDQDQFIIPEELLEAFRLFNSVHANRHAQWPNARKISLIPDHMNSVAIYMADYGLHNSTDFVELPGKKTVGNLQYFLDRDMAFFFTEPGIELVENMGLGEVIDDAKPPPSLNHKRKVSDLCIECGCSMVKHNQGKVTGYEAYAFYDDGAFSRRAIEVLDSGALLHFAPSFGEAELNLEAHVKNGFFAKDILHHACLGTLRMVEFMLGDSFAQVLVDGGNASDLMPFDQVEAALGFDDVVVPVLVKAVVPRADATDDKGPGSGVSST
ncbi:hypothetical protein ACET3Z_005334 [Daucus carota]